MGSTVVASDFGFALVSAHIGKLGKVLIDVLLSVELGNRRKACKGACIGMFLCRTKVLLAYLVWRVAVDPDVFSHF